jgi:hypothetical protein
VECGKEKGAREMSNFKDYEMSARIVELEQQLAEREKQIVEMRMALEKIAAEQVVNTTTFQIATKALDATQDLSGLVLCDAEPVAWSTFDGEGGYDYRSYIDNEDYRDKYRELNKSTTFFNWVEPLYKARKQP